MTSHILAGVDFSEGAFAALLEARGLAHLLRLELRVMHVRARGVPELAPETVRDWLGAAGVEPAMLRLREGEPWIELAREAAKAGTDLLVVGSHGGSGTQPIGLGTTAARLGLIAPCPLVLVGPRAAGPALSRARRHWAPASRSIPPGD